MHNPFNLAPWLSIYTVLYGFLDLHVQYWTSLFQRPYLSIIVCKMTQVGLICKDAYLEGFVLYSFVDSVIKN